MSKQERLFVVVNPTLDKQIALQRAIITSQLMNPRPELYVFVGIDHETVDTASSNDKIYRNTEWFEEQIHQPLKQAGLVYQVEISWSAEWQKAILHSAKRFNATRIMMRSGKPKTSRRFSFADSKWDLFKTASCPVLLIRDGATAQRNVVLAAVNFQASRHYQEVLNDNILTRGKWLADNYNATFHVVNAYLDSMHYPDRGRLAKATGLDSTHLHVVQGYTDEAIGQVAKDIQADIVVIGTLGQTGQTKSIRGNTAERVISAVDADVMVVNTQYNS